MAVLIGVDWGCGAHAVCVIDARGRVLDRFEVGHDRAGLTTLTTRLKKHGAANALPVAVKRPSGLLVDTLVEAGFIVTPIHPNVVKACRPRYRAVAAKSDPGDAFILADILRTDGHRLRPLEPQGESSVKNLTTSERRRRRRITTRPSGRRRAPGRHSSPDPG